VSGTVPTAPGDVSYISGSGFVFNEEGTVKKLHEKVLVSPTDTTPGYLSDKVVGASIINSGAYEQIVIIASGSALSASQLGQVMFSADGVTFAPHMPVTTLDTGWMVQNDGILIVVG
jgi:hypothetical protein